MIKIVFPPKMPKCYKVNCPRQMRWVRVFSSDVYYSHRYDRWMYPDEINKGLYGNSCDFYGELRAFKRFVRKISKILPPNLLIHWFSPYKDIECYSKTEKQYDYHTIDKSFKRSRAKRKRLKTYEKDRDSHDDGIYWVKSEEDPAFRALLLNMLRSK